MISNVCFTHIFVTHPEFVQAFHDGAVRVDFDPARSGRYLSARMLLPLFMLPVLGAGVALALLGHVWIGLAVIAFGIIAPRLIKRSAPRFLLMQVLEDETVFNELLRTGVLRVTDNGGAPEATP